MNAVVDLFGYAGTVTGVTFMLPQLYRSWRTGSVDDLSWWMLILYFINTMLWLAYGLAIWALPLVLTNVLSMMVAFVQLYLKARYDGAAPPRYKFTDNLWDRSVNRAADRRGKS